MKIKVSKHKLNIHYRGSPWGSRTQQYAYCLRYAHSQHIESHLSKKQPQAKIPIAFFVSQLHFSNVTSHALVYGGHLVMRSKRCAVQNQGITLNILSGLILWFAPFALNQALVAQKVDNAIHNAPVSFLRLITLSTGKILTHWMAELVFRKIIYWIMIYLVDSAIRRLENLHQTSEALAKTTAWI